MRLLPFFFTLYFVLCVFAGGIRHQLDFLPYWYAKQAYKAAGTPVDQWKIMPGRATTSFAADVQYFTGMKYLPDLPNPDFRTDYMSLVRAMNLKGINKQVEPLKDAQGNPLSQEKYGHLVKGANGITSSITMMGAEIKSLRSNNVLEEVDTILDKLENILGDGWHARQEDSHKYTKKDFKKKNPSLVMGTVVEKYSDGSSYERWDREQTLIKNKPEDKKAILSWEKKRSRDPDMRDHQVIITKVQKVRDDLNYGCKKS